MAAYSKGNGFYMTEQRHLLADFLKHEWGFEGYVMGTGVLTIRLWGLSRAWTSTRPWGERGMLGVGTNPAIEICGASETGELVGDL